MPPQCLVERSELVMRIELPATPMRQLFSARPRFRNLLQAPEVAAWPPSTHGSS